MPAMPASTPPRPLRVVPVVAAMIATLVTVFIVSGAVATAEPALATDPRPSQPAAPVAPESNLIAAAAPMVGEGGTFWVKDWNWGGYLQIEATVAYVGESCTVYLQDGEFVPPVTLERLGTEFDTAVYPALTDALGAEPRPGIDEESQITILLYEFADLNVSGYFSPLDIDPPEGQSNSNRREMIYLNAEMVASEPENAGSLAAHEFAHLIAYYRDYMLDPSPVRTEEPSWMYEGFSTYAEHLAGYDGRTNSQLRSFANDPGTNLTSWGDFRAHYGASYAFMSYLAMREGQGFVGDLVNQPADGIVGINQTLQDHGAFETFDTLFDDWVVANFLDGRYPEVYPYSYPEIEVGAVPVSISGSFPLTGSEYATNFGAVYLDFPMVDPQSTLRAVVDGDATAPLRAALISWDSAGQTPPAVTWMQVVSGDGNCTAPLGYNRHTLAVWARGAVGKDALHEFKYTASASIPGGPQFMDLGPEDPYYPYVAELFIRNVISGKEIPPGSGLWYFLGGQNVLRAQFAKMIMETVGLHTPAIDNPDDPTFADVHLTHDGSGAPEPYPYDYVEEAAALGIVRGYNDGLFRPYSSITRGQLVLMITRGAVAADKPLPEYTGAAQVFADVPVSHPYYRDIMTAYYAGIMNGGVGKDGLLYFYPTSYATRNHVAKMTANLISHLEQDSDPGSAAAQSHGPNALCPAPRTV